MTPDELELAGSLEPYLDELRVYRDDVYIGSLGFFDIIEYSVGEVSIGWKLTRKND